MELEDLKEYLGIIVDLEKNAYFQGQLIQNLQVEISRLGIPCEFDPPTPPISPTTSAKPLIMPMLICCVLAGLLTVLDFNVLFFLALVFCGFILLIVLTVYFFVERPERKKYAKAYKIYEQSYTNYQKALDVENNRMATEMEQRALLQQFLEQVIERRNTSTHMLQDAYSAGIIYEKYHTLPHICSIYEYIISGRCTTLYGSGGAYDVLENEIDRKTIICQLGQVLQELASIKSNQYMLYQAIQEGNQKLNDIHSDIHHLSEQIKHIPAQQQTKDAYLNKLQKNSAITAYNLERIEKELSYMNRMNYFAGKYDEAGMFQRRPPV